MQRAVAAAIALLVTASVLITRQSGQPATQLRCRPSSEIWIIRHGEKAANASRTLDLDLSPAGVDRAKNLERLVTSGEWPRFAAVYATSPSAVGAERTPKPVVTTTTFVSMGESCASVASVANAMTRCSGSQ